MDTISPRPSVLIVDRIDDHRLLIKRALSNLDCRVFAVAATAAAFEVLETATINLAVLDVPTTGDALGELISLVGKLNVAIVSVDSDVELANEHGCAYYQKPFSPTAFADAVFDRVLRDWDKPVLRKPPSNSVCVQGSTAEESIYRLGIALHQCATCHDRCPGLFACNRTNDILGQTVRRKEDRVA